ncbi:MAG: Na/Pi cotransporter family protein [Desulfuromonadales bacterium]|nr:Na/Pi cotransporter family protein [Desulfuromonadales bacterium]
MPAFLTSQSLLFGLVGGLGLFLYGMKVMSEGLQKLAGDRLRRLFGALTDNRLVGMMIGAGVTTLLQSSTAATVMVVGFVNAGLMSLLQAIGVVIGANIGTTVTAQLIAFNVAKYALPAIGIGTALKLFAKRQNWCQVGEVVLGLGLVFLGLALMKGAFDPFRGNPEFQKLFLTVGNNPLLGVLVGAAVTMAVQSSSATIGLTIAMATSGLLSFEASVAMILGENIGTTITANLAALGTNLAARRTALAHFLFNAIGVGYMLLLFPVFIGLVVAITPGDPDFIIQTGEQLDVFGGALGDKPFIARHIANAHTLFNVINALLFIPLISYLARLTVALIPGRETQTESHHSHLDARVLNTPPIALSQARSETIHMVRITGEVFRETLGLLHDHDPDRIGLINRKEERIDLLQREITDFLVALSKQSITEESSLEVVELMHIVNDLERICDHCVHLSRLVQRKVDQRIEFSEIARREVDEMSALAGTFFASTAAAFETDDGLSLENAKERKEAIDRMEEVLRNNHMSRLNTGECTVVSGLIYIDILHNLEKIGDHTFKLARSIAVKE